MASSVVLEKFKSTLREVAEQLSVENVQKIAILCEHTSLKTSGEIKDGLELFAQLQQLDLLNQDNTTFLTECLDSLQLETASEPLKLYRKKYFDHEGKRRKPCPVHKDEFLVNYCLGCDKKICSACQLRSHKKTFGCDVMELDKITDGVTSLKETLDKECESLLELCDTLKKSLVDKKVFLVECVGKVRKQVPDGRKVMEQKAAKHALQLCKKIEENKNVILKRLENEKEQIDDVIVTMEEMEKLHLQTDNESFSELREMDIAEERIKSMQQEIRRQQDSIMEISANISYHKVPSSSMFASIS